MKTDIRLSQCMIVKNEEKNIEQALSWGRSVVWEQIVVDTGSTDSTVSIAQDMGAKVFHFEWCDDFSAAKNYAIRQASGDWIAFLDADEYFSAEDAAKLPDILTQTLDVSKFDGHMPDCIVTAWHHLNDTGNVFALSSQIRLFRKSSGLRYRNRIHEILVTDTHPVIHKLDACRELTIIHTGYMQSVYEHTKKAERNIRLLWQELSDDSRQYDLASYLGESLCAAQRHQEALEVLEPLLENSGQSMEEPYFTIAYSTWFQCVCAMEEVSLLKQYHTKVLYFFEQYVQMGGSNPDVYFWFGCYLMLSREYHEGIRILEQTLVLLSTLPTGTTTKIIGSLPLLYQWLIFAYQQENNAAKTVSYCTMTLKLNRFQENPLEVLLELLEDDPATLPEQTYSFLEKIYDFSQEKDRLFVLRSAKITRYYELEEYIMH